MSKCALLEKAQSLLPPLCKGRWIAKRDGRVVELNPRLNNPSVTSTLDTDEKLILDLDSKDGVTFRDVSILLRFIGGKITDYYEAFTEKDQAMPAN